MERSNEQDVTPVVIEPLSDDDANVDNVAVRYFHLHILAIKVKKKIKKLSPPGLALINASFSVCPPDWTKSRRK